MEQNMYYLTGKKKYYMTCSTKHYSENIESKISVLHQFEQGVWFVPVSPLFQISRPYGTF